MQNKIENIFKKLEEKCKRNLTKIIKTMKNELIEILILKLTTMKDINYFGMDKERYRNEPGENLSKMHIIKNFVKLDDTNSDLDTEISSNKSSEYQIQGVEKFGYVNGILNKYKTLGNYYIISRKIKDKLKYTMHNIIYIRPAHLRKENIYKIEHRDKLSCIKSTYMMLIKVRLKFTLFVLRDFERITKIKLPLFRLDKLIEKKKKNFNKILNFENNNKLLEISNTLSKKNHVTELGKYFDFFYNVLYMKSNVITMCYNRSKKNYLERKSCNQSTSNILRAHLKLIYLKFIKLGLFRNRYLNLINVYNSAIVLLISCFKKKLLDINTMPAKTGLNASNAKSQLVTSISAKSKRSESAERENYIEDDVLSEETKKKSRKSTSVSALNTKVNNGINDKVVTSSDDDPNTQKTTRPYVRKTVEEKAAINDLKIVKNALKQGKFLIQPAKLNANQSNLTASSSNATNSATTKPASIKLSNFEQAEKKIKREIRLELIRIHQSDPKYTEIMMEAEVSRLYQQRCIEEMKIQNGIKDRENAISLPIKITVSEQIVSLIEHARSDSDNMEQDLPDSGSIINKSMVSPHLPHPNENDDQEIIKPDDHLEKVSLPIINNQPKKSPKKRSPKKSPAKPKGSTDSTNQTKKSRFTIGNMSLEEINEINDEYQVKYPVRVHGIIIYSDNLKNEKWEVDNNVFEEIVSQTGCDKYSIVEATISHDIIKKTSFITIKVDEYEDFKLIRDTNNWKQTAFGGTVLAMKPLPFMFHQNGFENNLEMTISVSPKNAQISSQKIALCETTYHLSNMVRIMNNSDIQKSVATNRFRFTANNVLAYVCACNDGIILNGIKYQAEPSINQASVCHNCGYANCRSSKKKQCTSKTRCLKCSELSHKEDLCPPKKAEYCINCDEKGHRCTHDGYCTVLQEKTFANNAFLLPLLLTEGIKDSKYSILRNFSIAVSENAKNSTNPAFDRETIKEICGEFVTESVDHRITKLEVRADTIDIRCSAIESGMGEIKAAQQEMSQKQTNMDAKLDDLVGKTAASTLINNDTNVAVKQLMQMMIRTNPTNSGTMSPPPENGNS